MISSISANILKVRSVSTSAYQMMTKKPRITYAIPADPREEALFLAFAVILQLGNFLIIFKSHRPVRFLLSLTILVCATAANRFGHFLLSCLDAVIYASKAGRRIIRCFRPLRFANGRTTLPMYLEAVSARNITKEYYDTVPDTGSEENAMDWETFKQLSIDLIPGKQMCQDFVLANGKSFKSIGQADVTCHFAKGECKDEYKVRFHVFSKLAAPVILGKEFLDQTQTLTVNTDRLEVKEDLDHAVLQVMHLNRPRRRMQCSVDGSQVMANADTGAEMNLISWSFVKKHLRMRSRLKKESLLIQFADGSTKRITASVHASLSVKGRKGTTNVKTKFFVLPRLTSETLVGQDTLQKADSFKKHLDAFIDVLGDDDRVGLNIIKWLTTKESRFMNAFRNKVPAKSNATSFSKIVLESTLSAGAFRAALAEADARELHRREQAEKRIASLSSSEQPASLDGERSRAAAYDSERAQCLALHQKRLEAQRT